jgi:hypothetical protein
MLTFLGEGHIFQNDQIWSDESIYGSNEEGKCNLWFVMKIIIILFMSKTCVMSYICSADICACSISFTEKHQWRAKANISNLDKKSNI